MSRQSAPTPSSRSGSGPEEGPAEERGGASMTIPRMPGFGGSSYMSQAVGRLGEAFPPYARPTPEDAPMMNHALVMYRFRSFVLLPRQARLFAGDQALGSAALPCPR